MDDVHSFPWEPAERPGAEGEAGSHRLSTKVAKYLDSTRVHAGCPLSRLQVGKLGWAPETRKPWPPWGGPGRALTMLHEWSWLGLDLKGWR